MARVCYDDVIKHVHGALTGQSKVVFKHLNSTKLNFTQGRPDKSNRTPSAEEMATRQTFIQAAARVRAIMADADQLATYKDAFKNQSRYATLRGYIFATVYASL